MKKELELYIHVPFCAKKCAYCDFLSGTASKERIAEYISALTAEIKAYRSMKQEYEAATVFVGGGTPSVLSGSQVRQVFDCLYDNFHIRSDAEITVEANPGTVTKDKLKAYMEAGINRISFGLQSADNAELKLLGRIHTFEEFLESYELARDAGFANINVDLISAIPKQTEKSWGATLKTVASLNPEHISAYSLIIEEGTLFASLYGEGQVHERELPDEETERRMYQMTEERLEQYGYRRYEISNYAKEGYTCRHNLGYWERKEYLGIGLGSSSLLHETRFHNTNDMKAYLSCAGEPEKLREDMECLSEKEQMEEFIFLGLRKTEGISETEFAKAFGKTIWDCYGRSIQSVMARGLLERSEDRLYLTKKGIDISNYVFAEILG